MKPLTKAVLLSAAGLPGLGQLVVLKRPKRAIAFMLPAIGAFAWLMYGLANATMLLMEEALSGRLAPDPFVIAERLKEASLMPGTATAGWIMLACWIASILDILLLRDRT